MTELLVRAIPLCDATGVKPADLENWHRDQRGVEFNTAMRAVSRGAPRLYDYENAVEIGVIGALVAVGAPPKKAARYAGSILRAIHGIKGPRRYLAFAGGNFEAGTSFTTFTADTLADLETLVGDRPPVFHLIDIHALLARIDALFEGDGGGR